MNVVSFFAVCENDSSKLYQALLEANMAIEVGLIALDALGLYCIHFKDKLQHSRTGGPNEPSTTRDQRLHVQLRSS